jgi:hypothetical protein
MKYIIYGLTDPDTQEIRYIGKSTSGLKRPKEHKKPCNLKVSSHKVNWIKSLIEQGKSYGIIIIEETQTPEELDAKEIYWIAEYKTRGAKLTNGTDGGEGALGREVTNETKEKLRQKRQDFHTKNPEVSKKLGESQRKQHVIIDNLECKQCSDCKNYSPLPNFSPDVKAWDGHSHVCKPCKVIRTNKYREENPTAKLSQEEWEKSYEDRKQAMSEGAKRAYENNPELKTNLSKKKSKPVVGVPVAAGLKLVEFESALIAYKEGGFNNTYISLSIKNGKPYKGYIWKFKQ